jgi:formyltetrahydrofolate-dependent phosphoribosylglycinamide formyltransferase
MNVKPLRLVVMISGGGSNLQALINAIASGTLNAQIVLVVSNRGKAYGLERAKNANIPTLYFPLKPYTDADKPRTEYDTDLALAIKEYQPDFVVLAGWMHVLSGHFLAHFPRRVINLHPALPGIFNGTDAIARAYEAYRAGEITHSGCMVHYAIPEVDMGDVIVQALVPFHEDDTLETYEARMHSEEHKIIVQAIRLLSNRR